MTKSSMISNSRSLIIASCLIINGIIGFLPFASTQVAYAYDAKAFAVKNCKNCNNTIPPKACGSYGMITNQSCSCYTEFTIQYKQKVKLSVSKIDKTCGISGYLGQFAIVKWDTQKKIWKDAYKENMGNPFSSWSKIIEMDKGKYRLDPYGKWGGVYTVEYWKGGPDCTSTILTINPGSDFKKVETGKCSSLREITFKNNGNTTFQIGGVDSSNPVFQLDLSTLSSSLIPGKSLAFEVKFCPPPGLTSDKLYSAYITVKYSCNGSSYSKNILVSGTGHVPSGELSVVSSFNVGEADWTLPSPQNIAENSLTIKNVGDESMTVNVKITDNAGGVFSLYNGGNVTEISNINIGKNSQKSVKVRATVSAETVYSGKLEVKAQYGTGQTDTKSVTLTAKGHHPVPVLKLHDSQIDYKEVEIDYKFHQALIIENTGDAELEFDLRLQDLNDKDVNEFILDLGKKKKVDAGKTGLFEMTFFPKSKGKKELFLVIDNTNEQTSTSRTVRLKGTGADPVALSTMLVVDRSGSMKAKSGTIKKIMATRDSGSLYTELIHEKWDWLGITRYNNQNDTPIKLAAISPSHKKNAQDLLKDISGGGKLEPKGGTGIGPAMTTASSEFKNSPSKNAQAMIVLTDGKENVHPFIGEVLPKIKKAYPKLRIFSVGIGDPIETTPLALDGIEVSKLKAIAENTNGQFKLIETLAGAKRFDLEAFYFKAFSIATGRQIAKDPLYFVPISNSMQLISNAYIAECDRSASFLIMSDLFKIQGMQNKVIFQDPTGQIIDPSASVGGIAVHVRSWDSYKLYEINFPSRQKKESYVGQWKVFLKPFDKDAAPVIDYFQSIDPTFAGNIPIAFMAAVGSDYRLDASLTKGEVLVGQPIHITAETSEAWWPNPGAKVTTIVTQPNGVVLYRKLYDDGLHKDGNVNDAIYGLDFTETTQKGYYEFLIKSYGTTERGEKIEREVFLSKYVGHKLVDRPERETCIPCWLLWLIIIFLIILLVYLFYIFRRFK